MNSKSDEEAEDESECDGEEGRVCDLALPPSFSVLLPIVSVTITPLSESDQAFSETEGLKVVMQEERETGSVYLIVVT